MEMAPAFAAAKLVTSQLRGFDFDDDAEQAVRLAEMLGRDELTPWGVQLLGVVRYRLGRWSEAIEAFSRLETLDEKLRAHAQWLSAHSRLRMGDAAGALAAFDAMAAAGAAGEHVGPREIAFGRGEALWALGRLDEAEQALRDGLAKGTSASVWLEVARLRLGQGDRAGALEALESSIAADDSNQEALYLRAAVRAESGDRAGALEALDKALYWSHSFKERARDDARFAALVGDPEFDQRVAVPPRDLGWLDRFPALARLRDDPALAALGVRFSTEDEAKEEGESLAEHYAGNWHLGFLWNDEVWAACGELAQNRLLLATCPSVPNRSGYEVEGKLFFDPSKPDALLFATSSKAPPIFWIPVAAEPAALLEALSEFYPSKRLRRADLTQVIRTFLGFKNRLGVPNPYSGEIEEAGPHELDRHWTMSPFVDPMGWGTAYSEEPWPDRIPPQNGYAIKLVAKSRELRKQREGGVCGFTHRTLFSRAQITFEIHRGGLYVGEIRYRPSRHSRVIEQLNERFGYAFPLDLPLDAAGALAGFGWASAEFLEAKLAEQTEPGSIAAHLQVIAALRHSDLTVTDLLRRYLRHESVEVRGAIVNLCLQYQWESLLEDLGVGETDPEIVAFIERVLENGIAPPVYDEMGEPPWLYEGSDDEDDEDDEDDKDEEEDE